MFSQEPELPKAAPGKSCWVGWGVPVAPVCCLGSWWPEALTRRRRRTKPWRWAEQQDVRYLAAYVGAPLQEDLDQILAEFDDSSPAESKSKKSGKKKK